MVDGTSLWWRSARETQCGTTVKGDCEGGWWLRRWLRRATAAAAVGGSDRGATRSGSGGYSLWWSGGGRGMKAKREQERWRRRMGCRRRSTAGVEEGAVGSGAQPIWSEGEAAMGRRRAPVATARCRRWWSGSVTGRRGAEPRRASGQGDRPDPAPNLSLELGNLSTRSGGGD